MSKKKKNKNMKEKEFNPDVDTGIGRPVRASIAIGDPNDKYSTYPSNGLTPRRLARIFRAADEGDVREQMEMFEEMEEKDTHLFSQLQTRKLAVTGLDWEVQPFSDDERDKTIAEFIRDQLKNIEKFDDILMDLLDAIGKGISVMEIEWGVKEGHNVIEDITYVHPKKLIWDSLTDEMKICTKEFPSGVAFPENKFVIHRYKAKSGHESRNGVLRVVSWMYLFKNYDLKDWVSFCEVFGMPLRLGKYTAAASEADQRALMEAIYSLGTDAAGIIPDSTMIEFIESNKTTSVEIYEKLRETHAMMEGRIYRADDPIWDIWYPPNGFRCRCSVVSMTKAQVERSGVEVSKRAPYDIDFSTGEIKYRFPDKGFSNNPAKSAWKPDLSGFDPSLKKEFKKRENKDIEK